MINKSGIGHILLFLVIMFAFYIITNQFNPVFAFLGILLIPIIFGLYHFIKSIVNFISKKIRSGFQSLLSMLLLLNITIKLSFILYNVLFYMAVIIVGFVIALKPNSNFCNRSRNILSLLIIMNLVLFFIPNNTIFLLLKSDWVFWGHNLTWNNFKGSPDMEINHDVQLVTGFIWITNEAYNYPCVTTYTFADPKRSWRKKNCCHDPNRVLSHEQGHFNIAEIYRRMAVDSANSSWGKPSSVIESIMNHFNTEAEKQTRLYDSETKHGVDSVIQKKWDEEIEIRLKK